jgi:hypothetical protein
MVTTRTLKPEGRSAHFNWSALGRVAPQALVNARLLAHHALQWPARCVRANLKPLADDSHSSFDWDAAIAALVTQPLKTPAGDVRVGLRLSGLALLLVRNGAILDVLQLNGKPEQVAGIWVDAKMQSLGLRAASDAYLPYGLPAHAVAQGARYDLYLQERELGELARWFAGAAAAIEDVRERLPDLRTSPVRLWPHHFDIATVASLSPSDGGPGGESGRSIGIGLSPGDEHYAQPYVYVSPSPRFERLPDAPAPGRWHTDGWFGAVATGDALLAQGNRGQALVRFILESIDIGRKRLGG